MCGLLVWHMYLHCLRAAAPCYVSHHREICKSSSYVCGLRMALVSCCRNLRDMLEAQLRNPAQRFLARVRQVCYEVRLEQSTGPQLQALPCAPSLDVIRPRSCSF